MQWLSDENWNIPSQIHDAPKRAAGGGHDTGAAHHGQHHGAQEQGRLEEDHHRDTFDALQRWGNRLEIYYGDRCMKKVPGSKVKKWTMDGLGILTGHRRSHSFNVQCV